jgi:hypothetical protein
MRRLSGISAVSLRERLLLASLPVSTGVAVLVTITMVKHSLLWPSLVLLAGTGASAAAVAWRLQPVARQWLRRQVRTGVLAGMAATAAYDLVRYGLVVLASWSVDPFKTFPLFGRLLLGQAAPAAALWVAGSAYHLLNGLGLAVGYLLVVPSPGLVSAVIWALMLETFTILLYPDWLGLSAVGEFFSVSMAGQTRGTEGTHFQCANTRGDRVVIPASTCEPSSPPEAVGTCCGASAPGRSRCAPGGIQRRAVEGAAIVSVRLHGSHRPRRTTVQPAQLSLLPDQCPAPPPTMLVQLPRAAGRRGDRAAGRSDRQDGDGRARDCS